MRAPCLLLALLTFAPDTRAEVKDPEVLAWLGRVKDVLAGLESCPHRERATATRTLSELLQGERAGLDPSGLRADLEDLELLVGAAELACGRTSPSPLPPLPAPLFLARRPDPRVTPGLVAVLPLSGSGVDATLRETFEEAIRTAAGSALGPRGFTVLTGETTLSVLAGNGVDVAKACEASCALEAARELDARIFVSGSLTRAEDVYVAFVRVFDTARGVQLAALHLEAPSVKELRRSFVDRAAPLFDRLAAAP